MALYRVSWRFAHDVTWPQRRKWTSGAFIDAPTAVAATAAGVVGWASFLRPAVASTIFCYEVYATDIVPGTDNYNVQSVPAGDQRGTRNISLAGQEYLTKACVTVAINVSASRPSRKFWRTGLYEDDVIDGVSLAPAVDTAIRDAFTAFLINEDWRDPDGQPYLSVSTLKLGTREFGRYAGSDVPSPPVG